MKMAVNNYIGHFVIKFIFGYIFGLFIKFSLLEVLFYHSIDPRIIFLTRDPRGIFQSFGLKNFKLYFIFLHFFEIFEPRKK